MEHMFCVDISIIALTCGHVATLFSRPCLSNGRAIGMVVVRLPVRPSVVYHGCTVVKQ